MSWSIGYDWNWHRDVGYGVPAICDHPGCGAAVDRGLSYVCGDDIYGGDHGCGLFFCPKHLPGVGQLCERCDAGLDPFSPTPDTPEWLHHKATHPSWAEWRAEQANLTAVRVCPPRRRRKAKT